MRIQRKPTKQRQATPKPPTQKVITVDGTGIIKPEVIAPGARSTNPDTLGNRVGNRIILTDSVRQVLDPTYPSPIILAHYIQQITIEDNIAWRHKSQYYTSKERSSGVHGSGIVTVLTRRMPSAFKLEDDLPNKMTQGEAIERHYFGFPWHNNTIYQPGPLCVDEIHLSPDGITPTMDPNLIRTFPNMDWHNYQPWMLEEMKATYYSSKRVRDGGLVRNLEFRGWLYQQSMYVHGIGRQVSPYHMAVRTHSGRPFLSRLTVWWVMDDYSFRGEPPVVECWILAWDYAAVNKFWRDSVLPLRHLAVPEAH
jgi:hypothetical protein